MLFSSIEEMQLVILSLIKQGELPYSKKKLLVAFDASKEYSDEKDQIYRVWKSLERELWKNETAIDEGFHTFIRRKIVEINEAFKYHDKNCQSKCELCEVLECAKELKCLELPERKPKTVTTSIS